MSVLNFPQSGKFCRIELATSDQPAAKRFYSAMFGWSHSDAPIGPAGFYTTFQLDGATSAAAYTLLPDMVSAGVPPSWTLYISVTDADAAAHKAASLGGRVCQSPFHVMDLGRMAILADPTGATFAIWQAKKNPGMEIQGVENAFCWADLSTPNPATAAPFYEQLFNWKITVSRNDSSGYLHIRSEDDFIGGIPPAETRPEGVPAHWLIYFQTADCDGSTTKAEEHGAKVHMPPMSLPNVGRIAMLADPQGATFALYEPQSAA